MPVSAASLARFAGLLADRSRAAMCLALLDGRAWTAGELARHAGVARSTASEHLTVLVGAGVLTERRQGRARYVELAGPEVAAALEDLGALAGERERPTSLRTVRADARLAEARTCYDHLAGRLGVAVLGSLASRGCWTPPPAWRSPRPGGAGSPRSAAPRRRGAARPCGPASTGPSGAPTSVAPSARRCCARPSRSGG
ncbi:ArsR/SmtB family transcription factor [Geodermatophilus sp. FMUSA9-8]|uniref:ArsR/SmtB family transcription factor n=1 Tax=Geodermatophilus sp. FMUSA9-8 TaxID=3120155 RepID=UPI00300B0020